MGHYENRTATWLRKTARSFIFSAGLFSAGLSLAGLPLAGLTLAGLSVGLTLTPARAADFTERYYDGVDVAPPYDRYASEDGDPYGAGNGYDAYPPEPPYADPGPYRGSVKDAPDAYGGHHQSYGYQAPRYGAERPRCVSRYVIKRRLEAGGWCDFARGEFRGGIAHVYASRARAPGRFKLAVDRCTGDVVSVVRTHDRYRDRFHGRYPGRRHIAWRDRIWDRTDWLP